MSTANLPYIFQHYNGVKWYKVSITEESTRLLKTTISEFQPDKEVVVYKKVHGNGERIIEKLASEAKQVMTPHSAI